MKTIKLITIFALTIIFGFTSCQSEEDTEVGTNPNANSSTSPTAQNYERAAMNDGSNDDFLDGNACTELLFPLTATVNGKNVTLISSLDFSAVLTIMGEFSDDSDQVSFNFPIRVRTSNYSEITVASQSDLNALKEECESAEEQGKSAVSCIDIQFPILMLTYDINLEQTGNVVVQSEESLFNFMSTLESTQFFAVDYPISATLSNGVTVEIENDAAFKNAISDCVQFEDEKQEAADAKTEIAAIMSNAKFKVESFVTANIETASDYANWSIEFTNDSKIEAKNTVNAALGEIEGTYSLSSETEVFLNLTLENNTALSALNNDWVVDTYSATMVSLKNRTDASMTLAFKKL